MEEELRRLVDAGITHVRTQIQTSWVFSGDENEPWDWECERMQEMYRYFKKMKEVGLTPIVVVFGSMAAMVYGGNTSAQADAYYLHPRLLDENGHPTVIEKWLVYFEIPDYEEMYNRWAQYVVELYDACKKHGGFYLGSIGGPAAILAQNNIKSIECVEYPELGMEAIWKIEVEDFPAFILVDDKGNDFFKKWQH